MRTRLYLAAVVALVSIAPVAAARDAALSWVRAPGAETCITLPDLATRVEKRVRGLSFVPAASAEINVEGSIARVGEQWRASLVISDAVGRVLGRRELGSQKPDCRSIDDALVLVIALALDPNQEFVALPEGFAGESDPAEALLSELHDQRPHAGAGGSASGVGGSASGAGGSASPLTAADASAAAPPTAAEAGLAFEAGVELRAVVGLVPAVGFGGGLHARLMLPALGDWAFELRAAGYLPRAERPSGGGVVEIGALQAGLGACSPAFVGLRGCAGVAAGALSVSARQLAGARAALLRPIVNPYAAIELAYRFGKAGIAARLGLEVPLIRDRIQVLDPDGDAKPVYRPAIVAGSLGVGVFLRFGS